MAAPESHRLTRQIVIAMLSGIVLGVNLNQLGAVPWVQLFLVDGLLQVTGSVEAATRHSIPVPPAP